MRGDLGALAHREPLGAFPVAVADQPDDERAGHQGGPAEDHGDGADRGGQRGQPDLPGDEHHRRGAEQPDPSTSAQQAPVRLILSACAVRGPPDQRRATGGSRPDQRRDRTQHQGDRTGGQQPERQRRPRGAGWGVRVGLGGRGQKPQQQVGDQPDPAGQRGDGEPGTHRQHRGAELVGHPGAHASQVCPVRSALHPHPAIVPAACGVLGMLRVGISGFSPGSSRIPTPEADGVECRYGHDACCCPNTAPLVRRPAPLPLPPPRWGRRRVRRVLGGGPTAGAGAGRLPAAGGHGRLRGAGGPGPVLDGPGHPAAVADRGRHDRGVPARLDADPATRGRQPGPPVPRAGAGRSAPWRSWSSGPGCSRRLAGSGWSPWPCGGAG